MMEWRERGLTDTEILRSIVKTFESDAGKTCLEVLVSKFFLCDPYIQGDVEATHIRLGERRVVGWILDKLKKSKDPNTWEMLKKMDLQVALKKQEKEQKNEQ